MVVLQKPDKTSFGNKNALEVIDTIITQKVVKSNKDLKAIFRHKNIILMPTDPKTDATGFSIVSKNNYIEDTKTITRTKENWSNKTNVIFIDWEVVGTLEKYVELTTNNIKEIEIKFNEIFPEMKSYALLKSSSHIEKGKTHKAHFYCVMDREYTLSEIVTYLESRLPASSFKIGANKNGAAAKQNMHLDFAVYQPVQICFEHHEALKTAKFVGDVNTFDITKYAEKTITYTDVVPAKKRASLVKRGDRRKAKRTGVTINTVRADRLRLNKSKSLNYTDHIMLRDGSYALVKDIVATGKQIRCYPLEDEGDATYADSMVYYPDCESFNDYHNKRFYGVELGHQDVIEVEEFIDASVLPKKFKGLTLIQAGTGMGKTYAMGKHKERVIMIVPNTSIVEQAGSNGYVKGTKLPNKIRRTGGAMVMTYDKFWGHYKQGNLPRYDVLAVDELHVFLTWEGIGESNDMLTEILTNRLEFPAVVGLTATPDYEMLEEMVNKTYRFIRNRKIVVYEVGVDMGELQGKVKQSDTILGIVDKEKLKKVLVFQNDKAKNVDLLNGMRRFFNRLIQVDSDHPPYDKMFEGDESILVAATSSIEAGYSIPEDIDAIFILGGKKNSVPTSVQVCGRARGKIPKVFTFMKDDPDEDRKKPKPYSVIKWGMGQTFKNHHDYDQLRSRHDVMRDEVITRDMKAGTYTRSFSGENRKIERAYDGYNNQSRSHRQMAYNMFGLYEIRPYILSVYDARGGHPSMTVGDWAGRIIEQCDNPIDFEPPAGDRAADEAKRKLCVRWEKYGKYGRTREERKLILSSTDYDALIQQFKVGNKAYRVTIPTLKRPFGMRKMRQRLSIAYGHDKVKWLSDAKVLLEVGKFYFLEESNGKYTGTLKTIKLRQGYLS